jgi:hypothetical protein
MVKVKQKFFFNPLFNKDAVKISTSFNITVMKDKAIENLVDNELFNNFDPFGNLKEN